MVILSIPLDGGTVSKLSDSFKPTKICAFSVFKDLLGDHLCLCDLASNHL